MKTVRYKGTQYRVIADRGSSVVVAPMKGRTPRQVLAKVDLDPAPPVKKKTAKKAKTTKKKATKKTG